MIVHYLYCDDFIEAGLHSMGNCCSSCHYETEDNYEYAGCETYVGKYTLVHCCSLVIPTEEQFQRIDIAKVLRAKRRKKLKNDSKTTE